MRGASGPVVALLALALLAASAGPALAASRSGLLLAGTAGTAVSGVAHRNGVGSGVNAAGDSYYVDAAVIRLEVPATRPCAFAPAQACGVLTATFQIHTTATSALAGAVLRVTTPSGQLEIEGQDPARSGSLVAQVRAGTHDVALVAMHGAVMRFSLTADAS